MGFTELVQRALYVLLSFAHDNSPLSGTTDLRLHAQFCLQSKFPRLSKTSGQHMKPLDFFVATNLRMSVHLVHKSLYGPLEILPKIHCPPIPTP